MKIIHDRFIFLISLSIIFIGFIASISARPLSFDIGEVSQFENKKRDLIPKVKREAQEDDEGDGGDDGGENKK
ncbi:3289_t:CDS:1, partial [Gigaspora rosea]